MRRLPAALLAAALLVLALPALGLAQAIDPGTPTTIAPAEPGTSTNSDGPTATAPATPPTTPETTPAAPPATQTTPVPTQTAPSTEAVPPPATTQPPPAAAQPAPATTQPAPQSSDGGSSRIGLLILIVLGALVLLLALIFAIARWQGVEPPWWPRARHSLAEFGWRASGAWSDFTDWVRLGR